MLATLVAGRYATAMKPQLRPIVTFIALVILFSSAPYFLIIRSHHLGIGGGLVTGILMWMPALAAFATCRLLKIDLATLGWRWRPAKYEGLAYLLPILYATPVYIACWIFVPHSLGFGTFAQAAAKSYDMPGSPGGAAVLYIIVLATFGLVRSVAAALGEEIGWRGFLLPRLTGQFGFYAGCFISGCIWAVWHYPALLLADYNSGTPKLYALSCFTAMVIATAFLLGWLRLRSRSLWPCAVLHASHNLFIQAILDALTKQDMRALYITTEFGFGLAITIAITAFYLIRRHPLTSEDLMHPQSALAA